MVASCISTDSLVSSGCSGICHYGASYLKPSSCECSSLDTSQELPLYIIKLARALQRIVQQNDADCFMGVDKQSCFRCGQAPAISIRAYIHRIAKHSKCSPVCFMMACAYLKRLSQTHTELTVTSLTVHRLVITAVMLAAKLMDDKYYNNAFYAKIGGITTSELNHMELEMLRMLEYRTVVTGPQIKELLVRLDVLQAPGRLASVLCQKRSSHPHDSVAHQTLGGVQKLKVGKGCTAMHKPRPCVLSGVSPEVVSQNVSVLSCKHQDDAAPAAVHASSMSTHSEGCDVVSVHSDPLLTTRHFSACLVLPISASLIDVSA